MLPTREFNGKRTLGRRQFIERGLALGAGVALGGALPRFARSDDSPDKPLKVAAIITEFTYRSHAHVILENFLLPYLFNGQWEKPEMEVVGFYLDQFPEGRDMARDVARQFGIEIYPNIEGALTLGGKELAVDAVLSIGEHGDYPVNEKAQRMYPRKRFFDEIAAVLRASGRGVPIFSDKHLSYRWDWAKEMVDVSRELNAPLMAGSSVPLAQRRPPMELPPGAKITDAVSIHGGGVESYDFHGLEVLQSMVEARAGGETGVEQVQFLDGDKLWKAAEEGLWSEELAHAAMESELGPGQPPLRELVELPAVNPQPVHGIVVTYRDGFRATMLKVGSSGIRWNFACHLEGESKPKATAFHVGPWQNRNLFKALSHSIQTHFREGRAPYPVERTLLVSGILDLAMESRYRGRVPIDTPQLDVAYKPRDYRAMREMGATWKIITDETPQPPGIEVVGGTPPA